MTHFLAWFGWVVAWFVATLSQAKHQLRRYPQRRGHQPEGLVAGLAAADPRRFDEEWPTIGRERAGENSTGPDCGGKPRWDVQTDAAAASPLGRPYSRRRLDDTPAHARRKAASENHAFGGYCLSWLCMPDSDRLDMVAAW